MRFYASFFVFMGVSSTTLICLDLEVCLSTATARIDPPGSRSVVLRQVE